MELIPDWAPNIHPLLVHFPIALLSAAVVLDFFSLFVSDEWWDERKTIMIYLLGTVSAIGVYFTGLSAADSVFVPTEAQELINVHSDWAYWTVWFFGIYTLLRTLLFRIRNISGKVVHTAMFLLSLVGIFFLFETGEHGAEMVFGYSVGTGDLTKDTTENTLSNNLAMYGKSTFTVDSDGNWSWEIGDRGVETLLARFTWLEGQASSMNPAAVRSGENNFLLRFSQESDTTFFITEQRYRSVQLDYYLEIKELKGQLELIHHAQDKKNYDFVRLDPEGRIKQGRVTDGKEEVFAESGTEIGKDRLLFIRVVGNGTHYRAYLNQELVVHGHGETAELGGVGMKLTGSGELLVDRIALTVL